MRHNHTIGFEADCAKNSTTGPGTHARSMIEAIASSCRRNTYLRLYVSRKEHSPREISPDRLVNVETMEPDGSLWRKFSKLWKLFGVSSDARNGGVELFHALSNNLPFGLARYDIRSVVTVHDLMFARYPQCMNYFDRIITRIRLRSSCRRADRIIAASECTKRDLIEILGIDADKIDVVHPGCDRLYTMEVSDEHIATTRERYNLPERYILNVGRLTSRKNVELILDAMTKLNDEIHLVIAGSKTSHTTRIKSLAKSMNLDGLVHFIHNATNIEMTALYKGADILVYPSHYSGFGTPIVEAASIGVPVITTTGSSHEEAGGKAAMYVSPTDSTELANSIEIVLNDSVLRDSMITRGKEYTSRFRPEVVAYNILSCYKRIGVDLMDRM